MAHRDRHHRVDAAWQRFNVANPFPNTGHPGVVGDGTLLTPEVSTACKCPRPATRGRARTTSSTGRTTDGWAATIRRSPSRGIPPAARAHSRATPTTLARVTMSCRSQAATTRLPVFTWKPIAGEPELLVIVASDPSFQNVIDEAYTRFLPTLRARVPGHQLSNTSTKYYWAVLPAPDFHGIGVASDPTPTLELPAGVRPALDLRRRRSLREQLDDRTQPTFQWSPVTGAYPVPAVRSDRSEFGNQVTGSPFTTEGTSFTASNFPASAQLYLVGAGA